MTDDLTEIGGRDRLWVSLREDRDVRYWTKQLGVTKRALENAVQKVGNSAEAVRSELFGR
jgi:Protein of unknown function (DUF3606)